MNEEKHISSAENEQLKQQTLDLFMTNNIEIDSDITDVFNEVFEDFELATGADDSVNIYFKEDLKSFENDMTINNCFQIKVNGISSGVYTATYTYVDNIEYLMNERTDLLYNATVVEKLVEFVDKDRTSIVKDPEEWCIVVTETITWENGEYSRVPKLFIYVPVSGANVE